MEIKPIAYVRTDFPEKFGIPRQSGLASCLEGRIVFEPQYRSRDAVRGLEDFSHIWIIWEFSANRKGSAPSAGWQPTVRPPRMGGNRSMGVFATRSPFRPNPLGLSCVELAGIDLDGAEGPVIHVRGADIMDGTPVYDIKPYIKYADSRPHAICGYVDSLPERSLKVHLPEDVAADMPDRTKLQSLLQILALDPRPSYQSDPERIYGICFAGANIRFRVDGGTLHVIGITPCGEEH